MDDEQRAIIARHNRTESVQDRIYSALAREKEAGRSLDESWAAAQDILAGKKVAYIGNADLDDTADAPYSFLFPKNDPALATVIPGIVHQQLAYDALPIAEKTRLRDQGKYGMTIKSVDTFWDDKTHQTDELQMSPSSAAFLQSILPAGKKMALGKREMSAGHTDNSKYSGR